MENIGLVLTNKKFRFLDNVDNDDKEFSNNVTNVGSERESVFIQLMEKHVDKPRALAEIIADKLEDKENLNFYIKLLKTNKQQAVFECVHIAIQAHKEGKIRSTIAKYFVGVLKRKGIKWREHV